jgi:hypothetical protein
MKRPLPVKLPRPEKCGRELRGVDRIRKALGLQAEAVIFIKKDPSGTPVVLEEMAGIELDPGFGRINLHNPPAEWFIHACGQGERVRPFL